MQNLALHRVDPKGILFVIAELAQKVRQCSIIIFSR